MLMAPLGHDPKLSNTFFAVMIAYLANYAIPRLGEVSRCGVLARYEKIPFAESFGTVIIERLVDVFFFLLLVVLVFFLQFGKLYGFIANDFIPKLSEKLSSYSTLLYILAIAGALSLALLIIFRRRILNSLNSKMRKTLGGFKDGFKTIMKLKNPWLFVFHSVFIWFIYYVMLHLCFLCLTETAGLSATCALTTLLFGTLAVIITPGGLGAYPPAVALILSLYAIDSKTIGQAIGWLIWLSQFASILVFGAISLVLLPLLNKENNAAQKQG